MANIGIIGAGIAGLQLALLLQQRAVPVTLYADRSPDQLRGSRLPNTVARFGPARARERALGVAHWEVPELGLVGRIHVRITGTPVAFRTAFREPVSFVDMRMYAAVLLEDFAARGGAIVLGALHADDLGRLSLAHDLLVVASGRGRLAERFPPIPDHSPYRQPQRRLFAGLFHGIARLETPTFALTISPGHGEIFCAPFLTFNGLVHNLLIEAIPGGELQPLLELRHEAEPAGFDAALLSVLREHAPAVYERIDPRLFRLTRPLDQHTGGITPIVRRGYVELETGRHAVAIGDAHVQNDPVLGFGANAASHAAWTLGEAILEGGAFDEAFCQRAEARIWEYTHPVTAWTNAALGPPVPHAHALLSAAAQEQGIADGLGHLFTDPQRGWAVFGSPEGSAAFLRQSGWEIAIGPAATV